MVNKYIYAFAVILSACAKGLPDNAELIPANASCSPDNSDAVIPCNIAPLNFMINDEADEYLTRIYAAHGRTILVGGRTVRIPLRQWKSILEANRGDTLYTEIYARRGKKWRRYRPVRNFIAPEPVDAFLCYRLIEPSYVAYERMSICQRDLTSFSEKVIYDNMLLSDDVNGQCINCHAFHNYNRDGKMQMHVRQYLGGTLIVRAGAIEKISLKTEHTVSAGVYPSWHPAGRFIAYSVNNTGQNFHTRNTEKIEVMDSESDIILYDADKREICMVAGSVNEMETFPSWSSDGKYLYYASARFEYRDRTDSHAMEVELADRYRDVRYSLMRKQFDEEKMTFGATDTVFDAAAVGKSATFPRESPDGRYLMFTLGDYGNFHIWHKSADLYLMDMQTRQVRPMTGVNSAEVESYHEWSSSGRWIVFSSRRDDGSYTRPYIAYFDRLGREHKPFILPQEDPEFYGQFFKSYNIPSFMVEPVQPSRRDFVKAVMKNAIQVTFVERGQHQMMDDNTNTTNFYE
ncbi:MAG: hypothetical protein LBD45_03995 [Bacteroidales bacterium]|jgi:hypothetical protein|nr:hypothetical protein [Bacteroidales bacterium]